MNLRKLSLTKETIFADTGRPISTPITRAVAVAVVDNPFADRFVDDLSPLFADGAELGQRVMPDLASLLSRSAVAYGKAAIVGLAGEIEHGAAMIHPSLGQPMREAVGGGEAITADALYGIKITYGSYLLLHFPILGALKTLLLIEISYRLFPEPQRLNAVPTQPAAHMSRDERVVAVVLSISLVLFITDVVHGISPAWVSLGAAVACLLGLGRYHQKSFRK